MQSLVAVSFALSLCLSLIFVPVVRYFARRFGMVDRPDAERKLHKQPVALAGGVAVFASILCTFVCVALLRDQMGWLQGERIGGSWLLLLASAGAIVALGLLDDVLSLRGRQKLLIQCVIILCLVGSGTIIRQISILGFSFQLGVLALPISVLWLLIATNALNLIDGADGMASTVGCIIAGGLALLSLRSGVNFTGVTALALCGALIGFLVYNRPPASIYLGDAGSMMIGLLVGVLAVWSSAKETTLLSAAPVAILALPLFDSSAAIVRRWLTGRSIYTTDRGHLHHLLMNKYGPVGMLLVVAAACLTMTSLAVASAYYSSPSLAVLGVVLALGLLIATRSFGHSEAKLVAGRTRHFVKSFSVRPSRCDSEKQERRISVQGDGQWEQIWEPLVALAQQHDVAKLKLNINLPWLHESFHAAWHSVRTPEKAFQMDVSVPLFATRADESDKVPVGSLKIVMPAGCSKSYINISELIDKLVDLEPQIETIVAGLGMQATSAIAEPATITSGDPLPLEPTV